MRKQIVPSLIARTKSCSQIKIPSLIAGAMALHLALVIIIYLTGYFAVLPDVFDKNGIGISFAIDSYSYRIEASKLAGELAQGNLAAWLSSGSQFHVKLYALSFAVFGRLLGFNILSAEPLNLFYYISILSLVFLIGREVFDRRVAVIAAGIVGLWPSFFLHTTQMLRDPLFIMSLLLVVFVLARWLTREFSWAQGLANGFAGGAACLFLWLIRGDMWELMLALVFLGTALFLLREIYQRRLLSGNLAGVLLLLGIALVMPRLVPTYRQSNISLSQPRGQAAIAEGDASKTSAIKPNIADVTKESGASRWSRLPARLGLLRHKFITSYPGAGSNVDTDVELSGIKDIVLYFPRAVSIGLCAPFASMWFVAGVQVGLKGRLLSGLEMLVTYMIEVLAGLAVWRHRRRLSVWLLLLITVTGAAALGYVVVNVSTLYRMRYAFWILLVLLGTDGLLWFLSTLSGEKSLSGKKARETDDSIALV